MQLFGGDGEKLFSSTRIDILEAIKQDKAIIINLNPNNYTETSKVLFRLITLDIRKSFDYLDGNTNLITEIFDEFGTYANDEFINVLINHDIVVTRYIQLLRCLLQVKFDPFMQIIAIEN